MSFSVLQRVRRALPLTLLAFAACGDDEGPRIAENLPVDAGVMRARTAQVTEVSGQAPIVAMSSGFGMFVSASVGGSRDAMPGMAGMAGARGVRGLRDVRAPRRQVDVGLFPVGALGRTFVRNAFGEWVVDTLPSGAPRPGAPAAGVRFVLQQTDMFGNANGPPVGTLDLTPRLGGSMTSIGYRGVVRALDGTLVLQWDSDQALSGESGAVVGRAIGGTRTIEMSESATMTKVVSSSAAAFAGVSRTSTYTADLSDPEGDYDATTVVKIDDGTVRIVTQQRAQQVSWRIYSNGGLFARMDTPLEDGPLGEPTWMRGDGRTPLDTEDLDALFALYDLTNSLPMLFIIDLTAQFWLFELSAVGMP